MAIGSISGINIKRAIFAPHTSQIILVVEEKNVNATVAAIHLKMQEMKKPPKQRPILRFSRFRFCSFNALGAPKGKAFFSAADNQYNQHAPNYGDGYGCYDVNL